jgi:hypothetical protein
MGSALGEDMVDPNKFYMSSRFIFKGDGQIILHRINLQWMRFSGHINLDTVDSSMFKEISIDDFIADNFGDLL